MERSIEPIRLRTPLTAEMVSGLRAGDQVLITGTLLGARDVAHKRLYELLQRGEPTPVDLAGQILYYVGPTPARPGRPVGSAGPTTSGRMDRYTPLLLSHGVKGLIGKGGRSAAVVDALKQHRAVYCAALGGAGALLAQRIRAAEVVAYPELGAEAIFRLAVEDFPVIVINDVVGGDLYADAVRQYGQAVAAAGS